MNEKENMQYQIELLEKVKKELGMNQSDISRKFEIGAPAVSKWATQKVKIPLAVQLSLELMLELKEQEELTNWVKKIPKMINIATKK